jgi:hydrogenase nickel incorporation protein HypA/HybF
MHEWGLAESIAEAVRSKAGERSVARVRVRIGALLRADEEALRQAFEMINAGTDLDGTMLELVFVPGQGVCHDCGAEVKVTDPWTVCPGCGGGHVHAPDGEDMIMELIEYRPPLPAGGPVPFRPEVH